jgi:hypothetical protein
MVYPIVLPTYQNFPALFVDAQKQTRHALDAHCGETATLQQEFPCKYADGGYKPGYGGGKHDTCNQEPTSRIFKIKN